MRTIVLVGFMGAGKSTVGRLLAARLGLGFVDSDDEIERVAGTSIAEIFAAGGEGRFRELERSVVQDALNGSGGVVALGGGALGDPATRAALEWTTVVHLDVSFMTAMHRVGDDQRRPLLTKGDVKALFDERQAVYRSAADITVATDDKTPDAIAEEIAGGFKTDDLFGRIHVATPDPYDVLVGHGLLAEIGRELPIPGDTRVAAVITHPSLRLYAEPIAGALNARSVSTSIIEVPEGEGSKDLAQAGALFTTLASSGLHRGDVIVAVGGGVVCDLVGFVASTYRRGIEVVYVPTTLLAQVDAAIGGKTAVNLPEGKNLVGTFHQPAAVICDVATLVSLPEPELISGLAEVVKYGLIADPGLLDVLVRRRAEIEARDPEVLSEIVSRAVRIKARIVTQDERDKGARAVLNYGHTLGHALEHARHDLRHGEAIALGMMAAAYLAEDRGRVGPEIIDRQREVLNAVGLPTSIRISWDEVESFLKQDKKYRGGLRFVLLSAIGSPEIDVEIPDDAVQRMLTRLAR